MRRHTPSSCRGIACSTPAAALAISRSPRSAREATSPGWTFRSGCWSARERSPGRSSGSVAMPSPDDSFDVPTVGVGVRNLEDLESGLRELRRVLRPGGRIGILELTRPRGLLRPFYGLWFDGLVPLAGKLLPGGSAYTYLPASVRRLPGAKELAELMQTAGFEQVDYRLFGGGSVALHAGVAS